MNALADSTHKCFSSKNLNLLSAIELIITPKGQITYEKFHNGDYQNITLPFPNEEFAKFSVLRRFMPLVHKALNLSDAIVGDISALLDKYLIKS